MKIKILRTIKILKLIIIFLINNSNINIININIIIFTNNININNDIINYNNNN